MPSESSYADRLGRAELMRAAIAAFTPAFAPSDTALEPAAFNTFVGQVSAANDLVTGTRTSWSVLVGERQEETKVLKKTGTRVLSYLRSSATFAQRLPTAKRAVDKLRGSMPRRPKAPAPPAEGEPEEARNTGDQSYADIAGHFNALVQAVSGLLGYSPTPVTNPITLGNLSSSLSAYRAKNTAIAALEVGYRDAVRGRETIFLGANGLRDKMKAIKAATSAQYGADSAQYAGVKGIKV